MVTPANAGSDVSIPSGPREKLAPEAAPKVFPKLE